MDRVESRTHCARVCVWVRVFCVRLFAHISHWLYATLLEEYVVMHFQKKAGTHKKEILRKLYIDACVTLSTYTHIVKYIEFHIIHNWADTNRGHNGNVWNKKCIQKQRSLSKKKRMKNGVEAHCACAYNADRRVIWFSIEMERLAYTTTPFSRQEIWTYNYYVSDQLMYSLRHSERARDSESAVWKIIIMKK